jgi:hypothetical protein
VKIFAIFSQLPPSKGEGSRGKIQISLAGSFSGIRRAH